MTGTTPATNTQKPKFDKDTSFKTLLVSNVFKCSDDAADKIILNGIACVDDFDQLTDTDIDSIVYSLRKPVDVKDTINLGVLTIKALKASAFGITRMTRNHTQCGLNGIPVDGGHQFDARVFNKLGDISIWNQLRHQYKERTDTTKDLNVKDLVMKGSWTKIFEQLDNHIGNHYSSTTKVSLSYLTRSSPARKALVGDEAPDELDRIRTLIGKTDTRGRVTEPALYFRDDNSKLHEIMTTIFENTSAAAYMKKHAKDKDGRQAYLALRNHFLGKDSVNYLASQAEQAMDKLSFGGQVRNWDFDKYCAKHEEHYNVLADLITHGYNLMDDGTRKRKFLAGIQDVRLAIPKQACQADTKKNFEDTVNEIKQFILMNGIYTRDTGATKKISEVKLTKKQKRKAAAISADGDDGDGVCELRYYTADEYKTLTKAQRSYLHKHRNKKRGRSDGAHVGAVGGQAAMVSMESLAAAMIAQVQAGQSQSTDTSNGSGTGNSSNPALTKQGRKG